MDRKKRAERLITSLRWLVLLGGLVGLSDELPLLWIAPAAIAVVVYNGALTWCAADTARFMRYGRRMSLAARCFDITLVTLAVANTSASDSLAYLLYWFVLVACGFTSASLRKLVVVTATTIAACAGATFYTFSSIGGASGLLGAIGIRSIVLIFGALVSAYVAKSRSQDDLVSERGSHLHAILNCGARLTSFRSVHELVLYVLETVATETCASGAQLLLVNEESGDLRCEASQILTGQAEESASAEPRANSAPGENSLRTYANWVTRSGREFVVRIGGKTTEETRAAEDDRPIIAMPLLWQSAGSEGDSRVLGVLIVWGFPDEDFGDGALDVVRIFAAMSAAAIVNLRLYTNLQSSFLRTLQSLANGLEARDEYTRGHSERVMQVACLIGEELRLSGDSTELLRNASLLHDIGKIGVPDAILKKTGKLTADEWEAMRRHPAVSEEICRPLGLATEILFLIKHHHERLDGKGYPVGLPAQDQPLLQRILVVADSFDAMRSRRPYRDIMPKDELHTEMNKAAGRTMDPVVVDALLNLLDSGEIEGIYEEHDRMTDLSARRTKTTFLKAA